MAPPEASCLWQTQDCEPEVVNGLQIVTFTTIFKGLTYILSTWPLFLYSDVQVSKTISKPSHKLFKFFVKYFVHSLHVCFGSLVSRKKKMMPNLNANQVQ